MFGQLPPRACLGVVVSTPGIRRHFDRNWAPKGRIRTIFRFSGAEFGRGTDVEGPHPIRRIAPGPPRSAGSRRDLRDRPKSAMMLAAEIGRIRFNIGRNRR